MAPVTMADMQPTAKVPFRPASLSHQHHFLSYYLCHEVASTAAGMSVILEADYWETKYGRLTPSQLAAELRSLSRQIDLKKHQKGKRKPKPKKKQMNT